MSAKPNLEMAQLLLENGADVDIRGKTEITNYINNSLLLLYLNLQSNLSKRPPVYSNQYFCGLSFEICNIEVHLNKGHLYKTATILGS